jgi:hypothetical protein
MITALEPKLGLRKFENVGFRRKKLTGVVALKLPSADFRPRLSPLLPLPLAALKLWDERTNERTLLF